MSLSLWMWMLLFQFFGAIGTWYAATSQGTSVALCVACASMLASVLMGWVLSHRVSSAAQAFPTIASQDLELPLTGVSSIDRPFRELLRHIRQQAREEAAGRAQLEELAEVLQLIDVKDNRVRRKLAQGFRQALGQVSQSVDGELAELWTALQEVESCAEEIGKDALSQQETIRQTTLTVEQARQRLVHFHEIPAGIQANPTGLVGESEQLVDGVERIRKLAKEGGGRLRALGQRTRDVNGIIQAIGEISARTDLLALNASIESVRAGEHGRGFAMVAEEVRKLSEQTAHAVQEVSAMVGSTELDVRDIIALLDEQLERSDEQCQRAAKLRGDLQNMTGQIQSDTRWRDTLITAADRQTDTIEELVHHLQSLVQSVQHSQRQSERTAWTVQTLGDAAKQFDSELSPLRAVASGQRVEVLKSVRHASRSDRGDSRDAEEADHARPATAALGKTHHPGDFSLAGAGAPSLINELVGDTVRHSSAEAEAASRLLTELEIERS